MWTFFAIIVIISPSVLNYNPLQTDMEPVKNEITKDSNTKSSIEFTTFGSDLSIPIINEEYWSNSIGYNEDSNLDFTGLTSKYGYPTESHSVTTEDGYILTIYRIVKGKKCNGEMKQIPVVMMHGLFDSSDTYIISGPDAGLAYLVADACYDVWLPNVRGNRYSKEHVNYTADPYSAKYWNFTYDEHGKYDLKAIVDYVLDATDSQQVSYIGHSQGTTMFYVLTSTHPEYNEKFTVAICLAPVAWLAHMKSILLILVATATPEIKAAFDIARIRELFQRDSSEDKILEFLCQFMPEGLCGTATMILAGGDPTTIGSDVIKTVSGHFPCAASSKNLVHYGQGVNINKFRRYDYGVEDNLEVYGSVEPPEYDVTKITAPVALIASRGDLLTVVEDIANLRARLPNVIHYSELDEFWGHLHFVWAKTVPTKLAPAVFELLDTYGS